MKEILNLTGWRVSSIDEILALASNQDLSCDSHFRALFVADGRRGFILIVENDSHRSLVDTSLSLFVDEF